MNLSNSNSDRNRILASLSEPDRQALLPHLEYVDLPTRTQLERPQQPITHIYFIESGYASVLANGTPERAIEIGMIGREGVTGLAALLGADRTRTETFMQAAGHGRRIAVGDLVSVFNASATLRQITLSYVHVFLMQLAETCVANARSKLEERLARWLLMASDRTERPELTLTHDFLASMLGVRRPGVSVALHLLQKRGMIGRKRGLITIEDRDGLRQYSNGTYGVPEAEFDRLFGSL